MLHDQSSYLFAETDDREWETDVAGFGRVFPHQYGDGTSRYFTTWLTLSPAGDKLVLDFAKQALVEEQLGEDDITDYLSVSFSATDYVGHVFGPSSLEGEDNILQVDRRIEELLAYVDEKIGLENTLVVLSADHGGPDSPGYLNSLGIPAGYVDPDSWDKDSAITRIKRPIRYFWRSSSRLTRTRTCIFSADSQEQQRYRLRRHLKSQYRGAIKVSRRFARRVELGTRRGNLPDTRLYRSVVNNFHSKRSGDIYVVFEPNWFINDFRRSDGCIDTRFAVEL